MKNCLQCGESKLLEAFTKDAKCKNGVRNICKICKNNNSKKQRDRTKYKRPVEDIKRVELKRRFHITLEHYYMLLEKQNNRCAGCLKPQSDFLRSFAVDHDHSCCPESGRSCGQCVRGLLCHKCNSILGYVNDDGETLKRLASYLDIYK